MSMGTTARGPLGGGKLGTVTNDGSLSQMSLFFAIVEGFMCRLTELLLKAVRFNSYMPSCRWGNFPLINPLTDCHS